MFGKGSSASRCDLRDNLLDGGCVGSAVEFPSSNMRIVEEKPLSDKASGTGGVTQVRPQKLHITLRPGEKQIRETTTIKTVKPGGTHRLAPLFLR